jgi:heme oxygenase (biliverdin-IX-beta and delta-forming)
MSAIAGLRSATWPSHQRLEKRLDVKARFTNAGAYRAHLESMWGFCAAIEALLESESFGGSLPDYETRRKLPLLTQDLLALGARPDQIASLPRCETVPNTADPAAAFGCAYVLEGATLGGRTLLPLVESRLGLTAGRGASYLASYGDHVGPMWHRFGVALDGWCAAPERQASAARAAVCTFDALAGWLCGESS